MASASNSKNLYCSAYPSRYPYALKVSFTEGKIENKNIENNTSPISISGSITSGGAGWDSSYNSYLELYWYDNRTKKETLVATSSKFTSLSANTSKSVSGSITVTHNDDGKLSGYAKVKFIAGSTSGGYCPNSSDVATSTVALTQIPRASGIASSSPFIGDTATITIDRKSASFTNTVTYDIGGITGTLAEKTSETVLSLPTEELVDEIYALIPNATQIQGTVYCTTYNGNTQIGSTTSASFYLYAKESACKPDVSGTIVDTNETTIALTGDSSIIVKYASIPKVTVNATAKKSAMIKSYNINANDGQQVNLQEYTFVNGIASDEVTINAKDSRGFGNPINLTPEVINYIPIIINVFKGERPEDVSNEVILNASGVWFNGEFKEGTPNTLACIFYYRESGSDEWIEGSELTPTIDGNTFKFEDVSLGNIFDYEKQWQIKLRVQDLTGYAERDDLNISKGQEVVAIGDDKVWVNGDLLLNDVNIVDLLYPIGRGFIDFTDIDYSNYLGLTWERDLIGMTPIGLNVDDEDFNEIGKTGGEKAHTLTTSEMPKHNHTIGNYNAGGGTMESMTVQAMAKQGYFWNVYTNSSGGGQPHNNMQPYQVVAYWKRVA